MKRIITHISVFAILMLPMAATADIYHHVDERGIKVFSDRQSHPASEIYLRERGSFRLASTGSYYPYREIVVEACSLYRMDEALIRAVMEVESDYNRYAVSSAGARGLMQLMPGTAAVLGVRNTWDPKQNIQAGTRHLNGLLKRFSGDLELTLAAYNAGTSTVIRYGSVPPYPQTQNYVKKVISLYRTYAGFGR
ncbi:MAG: lytic transglycosylase domain-containing protein [bacterium]|nr:lytic transglycosylase domain-containing protein [bacterium]MDT8396596.1 lytic transglycosylase domain-containing protein [bacterium]